MMLFFDYTLIKQYLVKKVAIKTYIKQNTMNLIYFHQKFAYNH